MEMERAQQIIDEVAAVYNTIAEDFAISRANQWKIIEQLAAQHVQPGQQVLDLGCGAGRVSEIIHKIKANYVGIDISDELIAVARKQHPNATFHVASMLETEQPDEQFDVVLLVASFHHIPTLDYRKKALEEILRITKPGGMIIMTNWNLQQPRFNTLRASFRLQRFVRRSDLGPNDILVPWKNADGEVQGQRYYHGFTPKEMERLIKDAPGVALVEQFYEHSGKKSNKRRGSNLVTILKKSEA